DEPAMFRIALAGAKDWLKSNTFEFGAEVKIEMAQGKQRGTLVVGEVANLYPSFRNGSQSFLEVVGFDRLHRLARGRHSRTFSQMTDGDIVKQIARDASLGVSLDSSVSISYEHIYQHNQSDLEFLLARARRINYALWVEDKDLFFKP